MSPRKVVAHSDTNAPAPALTSFNAQELTILRFALLEAPIKGGDSIEVAQLLAKLENGIRTGK